MKKITTLFLTITIAVFSASCGLNGETAVEIDGEKISIADFERYYYAQNKIMLNLDKEAIDKLPEATKMNHPSLNKAKFMESLIQSKLIINQATKDADVDQKELKAISEIAKFQTISRFYLMNKFKKELEVSDEEVQAVYKQYRNQYRNVAIDKAEQDIKQKIQMNKFQQKSMVFLQKLVGESQIKKDGFEKYLKGNEKKPVPATTEKKEEVKTK